MLDYDILSRKASFSIPSDFENTDKVSCIDLLSTTYKYKPNIELRPIYVNDRYTARPDLVSLAMYGTDKYADIICKINGISNPFELNAGDILLIPDIDGIFFYTQNGYPSELTSDDNTIITTDNPLQKQKNERRTGNEQVVGDSNYIIDKSSNLIFY